MALLSLLACLHTPPHDPVPGTVAKDFVRREQFNQEGEYCAWEAENLVFEGQPLWVAEAPADENWCLSPMEASRWVDILGQDGPYLSVILHTLSCCPDVEEVRCLTMDVRTAEAVTLAQYDEKRAERRWKRAQRHVPEGHTLDERAFVVGDRHVRFCAQRGTDVVLVPVR